MGIGLEKFRSAVVQAARAQRKNPALELDDDTAFKLYGLDSLDVMNLVLEVEGILSVNFGELDLGEGDSILTFFAKVSDTLDRS